MNDQPAITADMSIGEVIHGYPDLVEVFFRHGLTCVGCAVARFESIGQGAIAHGIDVDALVADLNQATM